MNPETIAEIPKDQKSVETERFIFRREVQYKVMEKLGFHLTKENSNDVFIRWYNEGKAATFAQCFSDIVPTGSDRNSDEIEKVAELVAIEMKKLLKH